MKAVILAGGFGTRISEETEARPKPMIEIGGKPLLWHIMKIYTVHGITDFVVCLGYKGEVIKEYFANYYLHDTDVTFDMSENRMQVHHSRAEPWTVTLVDTGSETMTGGRLKRVLNFIDGEFCFTYGDGLSDLDISALIETHRSSGRLATVTAVQPAGRWGEIELENGLATGFLEKPRGEGRWVNGGFFVLSPEVGDYIDGDGTAWEEEPLKRLAAERQLSVFKHMGFWQAMDTLRDLRHLRELWGSERPPWKQWT
jgi:glucose-1-phosphate cytidylyltransferase